MPLFVGIVFATLMLEKHVKHVQMIVGHVGLTIVEMEYVKNI
jgi:hypothetical protein